MASEAGLLLVDKPAGATSHQVILEVRKALGVRQVGHTGTLDPFATGLLLALVGPFTRLAELFHALPKTYDATLELGRETDTDDLEGVTTAESPRWRDRTPAEVRAAIAAREGPGFQVPSTYSAKQLAGRRAYEVARHGGEVELTPAAVTVHELSVASVELPEVRFQARVSTGTYVRALARDLGRDLGCGAHLTSLRRTSIGPFAVDHAVAPERLVAARSAPADAWYEGGRVVPWLPRRRLSDAERADVEHGRPVEQGDIAPAPWSSPDIAAPQGTGEPVERPVALLADERLVAIAAWRTDRLHPRKVFPA